MAPLDPHSYADSTHPLTNLVELALYLDFETKTIRGAATLHLSRPHWGDFFLDTRSLHIKAIYGGLEKDKGSNSNIDNIDNIIINNDNNNDNNSSSSNNDNNDDAGKEKAPEQQQLPFELSSEVDEIKGAKLTVRMGGESAMRIVFRTEGEGSALQWLEPGQTAAGKLPYVFTQCQAIHARSIFPCQDTPAARIRYRAKVNVPSEMAVVMSAAYVGREGKVSAREEGSDEGMARSRISGDEEEEAAMAERGGMGASLSSAMGACDDRAWQAEGRAVECFRMEQSIPPYLFAMAAGEIVSFDLSPRSRIYAEPPILAAAAHEFSETESMMLQAEALFGPYEWDRLDLIVMPPSFPYGGMENPRMVFLTPTLIAGDKSGVQVVAHELAHSWTGNLITNATNDDFWLNEGFTTYAERRIVEALHGKERANLHLGLGWSGLKEEMERFKDRPEFTKLKTNQEGVDPDEVYSQVPYEKGCQFLIRVEAEVGRAAFDDFLKKYISTFRFTSISTETFLVFLKGYFVGIEEKIDLNMWVYQPGIPPDAREPKSTILDKVLTLASGFRSGQRITDAENASWEALEWQIYLENLPKKLQPEEIAELDEKFRFSKNGNWEIKIAFLTIAAFSGYEPCFAAIEAALHEVGRMKYLRPLYSGLLQSSPEAKDLARKTFLEAKDKYHPIAQSVVKGLMQKFDQ